MPKDNPGFDTLAIHAGAQPDPTTGARATPIYQTTSFVFNDADHAAALFGLQQFGNIYTRIMNPTQAVLEERVAALEGGTAALAVSSGHAAQLLVFHTIMQPGDNFVAARRLYGGSINQFGHAFKNFGWQVRWADPADPQSFESQIDDRTRGIFIESLANPGGTFVDIAAIAAVAHKHGLPLIVDNTMATPYLVRPLEHGADIVVHSLTKFMGGHGNSMGGVIVDGGTFDWSKSGNYPMLSQPRPEYAGMVGLQDFDPSEIITVAAKLSGGDASNWEVGKQKLLDLKPNVKAYYSSDAASEQLISTGETPIQVMLSMMALHQMSQGVPLAVQIPKEGAVMGIDTVAIMKGTKNLELAYAFVNAALDPAVQAEIVRRKKGGPMVSGVEVEPEIADLPGVFMTAEEWKNGAIVIDPKLRSEKLSEWRTWFSENMMAQ